MKKYGNWVKYKDLPKRDKIFRIINLILMFLMLATTIGLLAYYIATGDKNNRLLSCIGMSLVYVLPFLYELIFRRRISNLITFYYLIYALFAGLVGCVLYVYHLTSWYDIVIHTLAGYTFSFLGIIIISRLQNYKSLNPLTIIIFCFFCTLAVELVWELCEWFSDVAMGQTAQGEVVPGYGVPLVTDTDLDMLCNLTGGLIFVIQFLIGKYTKFSFGVKFIEEELCPKKNKSDSENRENEETSDTKKLL